MADALDRVVDYVTSTLESLPLETCAAFDVARGVYQRAGVGGGRLELEEMIGQSRLFEIDLGDLELSPIMMGNGVPVSYEASFPVVFRYEGGGPHARASILQQVALDVRVSVDAIQRGQWSSVGGCVAMRAEPGTIQRFVLSDDAGHSYEGYSSEVVVLCSFDD